MSARRAMIRKEQRERAKLKKRKDANGEIQKAAEHGKLEGRTIAFCVIADHLYDVHGFRQKRIEVFLTKCNREATRFTQKGFQFVLESYAAMLLERINKTNVGTQVKGFIDHVYICQRDEYYVSSIALMLTVLNSEYGMGSNRKNTGRLDELMEYCTLEYMKIQLDPQGHNVDWYVKRTKEKTGIRLIQ